MLNPRAGEEAELAEARAAMQKGARLGEDLQAVAALLDGADGGLSALRQAARRLDRIAGDHELRADAFAALDRALIEASDAGDRPAAPAEALAFAPARLAPPAPRLSGLRA